jgi:RNA polymerase sigma-70 factor, ECF subfamily
MSYFNRAMACTTGFGGNHMTSITFPASAVTGPAVAAASSSHESLIKRIAGGDKLAMQVLYTRHHVRIFRFVVRLVHDESMAEDLISEVFLDVWRQADRFEGRSAVSTWLMSIARFKALSARRRRADAELDETIETTVADTADGPEATLEKKNQSDWVRHALTELSAEQREVIDLVYYHEQSVDEAAQVLGIPAATVKTRMFYARKKLGEWLKAAA